MSGSTKLSFKKPKKQSDNLEFMYYPDINDSDFYPHIWSKKEFYENKSLAREYYDDPKKKKALLDKTCAPDILKLKNHQVFLRNFLSPETPYNSILVFHGIGTGKCVLPETEVFLNGGLHKISNIWEKYSNGQISPDNENGEWSEIKEPIFVNSYNKETGKMITCQVKRLYRQKISEPIKSIELEDGKKIRLTQIHHLLTENGWSNDFKSNSMISVPNDQLTQIDLVGIKNIKMEDYEGFVYDLEVEEHHNYVANGILCHNTCAGVTIAEGLKDMVEKYNKKIYVIANKLLQGNFQSTLYNISREKNEKYPGSLQCTKTTYYIPPKPKESADMRNQREKAIRALQNKYYTYKGYIAFVNFVDNEVIAKGHDLGDFFNNSVFIIDEAHNLIAKSSSKRDNEDNKKTRQKLHEIFKVAKNTKLVMLTATPITNEIDDIVVLMNLLRANDGRRLYTSSELSTDGSSKLTKNNLDQRKFSEYVKGYVSYFRGAHPSSFPLEIPISNYDRVVRADFLGDQLRNEVPNFKELSLVTVEMSYFHFYNYFQHNLLLEKNSIGGNRSRDSHGDQLKIQATTAMYPLETANDDTVGTYTIADIMIEEKHRGTEKFKYRTKEQFFNVAPKNEKFLHDPNATIAADNTIGYPLAKYSGKFYRMFYDIVNTFGINFVFTRYRTNVGTIPISLLLEQNGFVRYHKKLGKPNEFTGKYREGVNNNLDIRNVKYRCICGYLDDAHSKDFNGKPNWRDPKKHRFLQATYLRVDGESKEDFETHRKQLNSPDNKYGQVIKVIVGGQNMREGVDLSFVRSVHIMNPWHNLIQIEQTIGRAIRLCSHSKLDDVDDMNVKVFKYVSIPPQNKLPKKWSLVDVIDKLEDEDRLDLTGVRFRDKNFWLKNISSNNPSDWQGFDESIYTRALNKDYNIKFAERLMKKSAIDCYLNHEANINFPNQIDGTRVCDYTKCQYECNYPFEIKPNKVNLDTYDLYFMEPKVLEAQEVIGNLFTKNWALTLESILDLAQRNESSINRDIIYLALDRMLGDPPRINPSPVLDQFGRYGYLIYRHPFYVYQPEEIIDENLPIYNRKVPSKPNNREIDIKELIKPKQRMFKMKKPLKKASPSDKLSNDPPVKEMTQNKFGSQIENYLVSAQNQDEITLAGILDYFDKKEHEYLIRTRIEDLANDRETSTTDKKIVAYYMENFIIGNTKMNYDENDKIKVIPKNGTYVYNLSGRFFTYNLDRKRWIEIHEDNQIMIDLKNRQESKFGPNFEFIDREVSPEIYGYLYDDNKKREIKFKITDVGGQQVKTKRYSEETNIKTLSRGQVCGNYSNEQLEKICDRLGIKYSKNLQRNNLCSLIEKNIRVRNNKGKYIWFLNYFQYKRKFDRLENTDIRSLYNFYRT